MKKYDSRDKKTYKALLTNKDFILFRNTSKRGGFKYLVNIVEDNGDPIGYFLSKRLFNVLCALLEDEK